MRGAKAKVHLWTGFEVGWKAMYVKAVPKWQLEEYILFLDQFAGKN